MNKNCKKYSWKKYIFLLKIGIYLSPGLLQVTGQVTQRENPALKKIKYPDPGNPIESGSTTLLVQLVVGTLYTLVIETI